MIPVSRYRQNAINSFRAKATIPILRIRLLPAVLAGQALVSIEAMKMENELRSKSAGTVKTVLVTEGVAVEKGTILVELE